MYTLRVGTRVGKPAPVRTGQLELTAVAAGPLDFAAITVNTPAFAAVPVGGLALLRHVEAVFVTRGDVHSWQQAGGGLQEKRSQATLPHAGGDYTTSKQKTNS